MRSSRVGLIFALVAAALAGCSTNEPIPHGGGKPAVRGGRIVVMAPSAMEILDRLGAVDRVVGVGDFVRLPPHVSALPRVGDHDAPNIERVLEIDADLLVTVSGEAVSDSNSRLRGLGIDVLGLDTSTFDGVFGSLRKLGAYLDLDARAAAVERELRDALDDLRTRATEATPRRVLFVVGKDPLYVAGHGSHVDEMIRLVGGVNVAHDTRSPYQLMSMETVLERMPEVIIDTSDNRPGALRGRIPGPWQRWAFVPAVTRDRVFFVEPDRLVIPGMRLPEMTELMGRLIHPEIFGQPASTDYRTLTPVDDPDAPRS